MSSGLLTKMLSIKLAEFVWTRIGLSIVGRINNFQEPLTNQDCNYKFRLFASMAHLSITGFFSCYY